MTAFTGIAVPGSEYLLGAVLDANPMPDMGIKQAYGASVGEYPASYGAVTDNAVGAQAVAAHTGVNVPTYGSLFYGRVYIDPTIIDLGQMFFEQTIDVVIFNGYLDASKAFSRATLEDGDGITLSTGDYDAPPLTMAPLEELHYTLTITRDGPAAIACTVTWDFDGDTDDAQTEITGSRVMVWPLPWQRGATETLEWMTDVLTGDNGTEQRISLRQSPRQTYNITSFVPDSVRSTMDNLLYGGRAKFWGLPIWPECSKLTANISVGDSIIYCSTLYADYAIGGECLVYTDSSNMSVGTISDFDDTSITVEYPFAQAYNTQAKVMPLKTGRLKSDPEQKSHGGHHPQVSATFLLTDLTTVEESTPDATYDDIDVETEVPLLSGGAVNDTWEREMTVYDFGPGVRRELSTWDHTRKGRAYTRLLKTRADILAARKWLMRRRGKAVPFYQPTYQEDLVLTDLDGEIGNFITCTNNDHVSMGSARENIAFFMNDGSVVLRAITGAEASTDDTIMLTLDSSIFLDRVDVKHISYIGCKRMASDSVEITWNRTDLAEIDYSIVEIRP